MFTSREIQPPCSNLYDRRRFLSEAFSIGPSAQHQTSDPGTFEEALEGPLLILSS